ncbi:hypothetical protein CAPTEDRAFT_191607 [Capitella teleta]|uniref:Uncharacterized protein n=1 Tax=Capitella teleta TaxID=283909 RepID=R7V261_CAPTE|nr:hypothetical protein CAPTEDRAFT_191607 [Capitella teleta]|eukprot:ELU09776.1 hypothetical protein CAPTEDRAFT_191607 [Capitella teleta]
MTHISRNVSHTRGVFNSSTEDRPKSYALNNEYKINEDDDKEPDSNDDCDCDLELPRPPAVTTLGLLSQATRTEEVEIKTWIMEVLSGGQHCADGLNRLRRLITWQFSSDARPDSGENDKVTPSPFPPPPPPLSPPPPLLSPSPLPQENQI